MDLPNAANGVYIVMRNSLTYVIRNQSNFLCCGYFINFTRDIYVSYFTNLQHVNIIL